MESHPFLFKESAPVLLEIGEMMLVITLSVILCRRGTKNKGAYLGIISQK